MIKAFGTAALVSWSLTSLVTVAYLKRNKVYYFEPCWHLHFLTFQLIAAAVVGISVKPGYKDLLETYLGTLEKSWKVWNFGPVLE